MKNILDRLRHWLLTRDECGSCCLFCRYYTLCKADETE